MLAHNGAPRAHVTSHKAVGEWRHGQSCCGVEAVETAEMWSGHSPEDVVVVVVVIPNILSCRVDTADIDITGKL